MSLLRKLFPRTYVARRNLVRARARSALAVLTIVIGVVAIASLGSFGAAFETSQRQSLGDIGNQVFVGPGENADLPFDERFRQNVERVAGGAEVVPLVRGRWTMDETGETVMASGIGDPAVLYDARNGSIPTNWRSGVIAGAEFADDNDLEVGESAVFNGETYRIQAILEEEGQFSVLSVDDGIVVPPEAIVLDGYSAFLVQADSTTEATRLATEIRADLNERREQVFVRDFSQYAERIDEVFWQLQLFLIGIGSISLLVAGISIANVMLMSAIERREEIGVLRAVGYQRRDVLGIMLIEAMLLGVIGAVVGIVLSLLATMGINDLLLGDPTAFQPRTVTYTVIAFAFGVGVSLIAGLYPAWKASRKPPVEALRG